MQKTFAFAANTIFVPDFLLLSIQFSHSAVSDSLPPHGLQHTRLPCPSPTPGDVHRVGDAIQPFHLLLSPSCPAFIFPSIRVFSNKLALGIRWPKYWSFSFSISPSNRYSGWIFFRIIWFDLFAVQGTLKSLLQHHSLKASVLWHSAFFTVQLSHLDVTTGKTIALTMWTFVGKVMSLLFKTLSWFGNPGKTQIRSHCSSAQKLLKSVESPDPHSGP